MIKHYGPYDFTPPIRASSARVAAALEMSACLAMCSISSDLFTKVPPLVACLEELVWSCLVGGRITTTAPGGVKHCAGEF